MMEKEKVTQMQPNVKTGNIQDWTMVNNSRQVRATNQSIKYSMTAFKSVLLKISVFQLLNARYLSANFPWSKHETRLKSDC